jgi:dihydropteroate synthase
LLGITPEESLAATSALNLFALERGATILRVHDVREAVDVVKLYKTMSL